MDGSIAVAFLVGCASNVLICQDLPTQPDRFADMEACRAALPALILRHERRENGLPVVMGKCGLMIRPGPSIAPPATSVLAGSLQCAPPSRDTQSGLLVKMQKGGTAPALKLAEVEHSFSKF
jgi:hypothetical protein